MEELNFTDYFDDERPSSEPKRFKSEIPMSSLEELNFSDSYLEELNVSDSSLDCFDDKRPSSEPKRIKYCSSIETNPEPERPCSAPTKSNVR